MDDETKFISKDFKDILSEIDLQPIHTRRNHPKTNSKIERMNGIVKAAAIRKNTTATHKEVCSILNDYQYEYNYQRLHVEIQYLRSVYAFFGRDK